MFRGILSYVLMSVYKSRMIYLYLLLLVVFMGSVFVVRKVSGSAIPDGLELGRVGARQAVSLLTSCFLFLAVFSSSRLLPAMLKPGLAGYFLARPISRVRFLSYTTLAILISYGSFIVIGSTVYALTYTTALSSTAFPDALLQIGLDCIIFAVYAPLIVLFGVTTRSGSLAFMGAFGVWLIAQLLDSRAGLLTALDSDLLWMIGDTLYYALPKSSGITGLWWPESLAGGKDSLMPLWTSALTGAFAYALAVVRFRRMEF